MKRLVGFFLMARVLRNEPIFGVEVDGALAGVALMSNPAGPPSPPALATLREQVWGELGTGPRSRYEAFGAATGTFEVPDPHLHLNIIAVRRARHGSGLGRRLLEVVHAVAAADGIQGVSLTTEREQNVRLYEHFGYRVVGHARVGDGLETWGMFRSRS